MPEVYPNIVGSANSVTSPLGVKITVASTDTTLYSVTDYDPETGSSMTVPQCAFEPHVLVLVNENTALSSLVQLFDVDRTNAVTYSGTAKYEYFLAPGETVILHKDDLLGLRFYYDVDGIASQPTVWTYIAGAEY